MAVEYTEAQREAGQRRMVQEGVFSRVMDGLTGGVLLAGLAVALGATDLQIGVLTALPFLAQLAHVPAMAWLRRFPERRAMVVWLAGAARLLLLVVAAIPFLGPEVDRVDVLLAVMAAYATLATLSGAGWQVWVRELVPPESLAAWWGRRMAILSIVGLATLLAAGQMLSWWSARRPDDAVGAYCLLFALGALFGLASALVLSRAPSVPVAAAHHDGLRVALRAAWADREYRRVLAFLAAWSFAANLALPFVSIVLLRAMGYPMLAVTLLAALGQAASLVGLRLWSPAADRHGGRPVLVLCASLFLATMLGWALLPKAPGLWALPAVALVQVMLGFATAGLDVASTGLVMRMAPLDEAAVYLSSASVVKAVGAGSAPLVAGLALTLLGEARVLWLAGHDALFLASVAVGLLALHLLLRLRSAGAASPRVVVRGLVREASLLSLVAPRKD